MNTGKWIFVATGVVLLMVAALAGSVAWTRKDLVAAAPGPASSAQIPGTAMAPLPEAPCTVNAGVRTCEVWALPGSLTMPDGAVLPTYGFATSGAGPALVPGPVITITQGMTLEVVLHNEIVTETVSLAFPGQEGLVPDLDGVAAGGVATYTFSADTAGTFVYEAGLTEGGARQVTMGLAGPLIVEEATPAWEQDQEVVLVLNAVDPGFHADPLGYSMNDFRAKYWLINGQAYPDVGWVEVMTGTTVLMRYVNAGMEHHTLSLLGLSQDVVAADGETLPFPQGAVAPDIMPGQTLEALVEIPATAETDTLYPLYNGSLHQHNNNQRMADGRAAFGGMLTFLRVTAGGQAGPAGPVPSNVTVTPQRTTGAFDGTEPVVVLAATLTDADSNVVAYEWFVNEPGTLPGSGTVAAPAPSVEVEVSFTSVQLATLPSGMHEFYIRGRDGLGNWGPLGSAVLNLDKAGPEITGLQLHPNPTNGEGDIALSGTADDRDNGGGGVVAASYRLDGGAWRAMSMNRAGSPVTALTAMIPHPEEPPLAEGTHLVEVRAQDDLGNWSQPYGAITLRVDKTGPDVTAISLSPNTIDFGQPYQPTIMLQATIADPLVAGVQSTLVNAEGFIDTQGAPGTGFALYPADGLFDELVEEAYYLMPAAHFGTLAGGTHQVIVVGRDAAGNWGPAGSASITVSGTLGMEQPAAGEEERITSNDR